MYRSVITGTGSCIPPFIKKNSDFAGCLFYDERKQPLTASAAEVAEKFRLITGIAERRYASSDLTASDIGAYAAEAALADSAADPETLDMVIVAHNFGNVLHHTIQTDILPSVASLIKQKLGIKNPNCIAYDIIFGCPGWVQGLIQADAFFRAGTAKKALIIGTETLSRVLDDHDRDSMIFSDGAGACVLEYKESGTGGPGILGSAAQTFSLEEAGYIYMGCSNRPDADASVRYIKMKGRKVYEFAVKHVPAAMKACLDKSGAGIEDLKKIFIHQANEKMDEAMIQRLYQLYENKKAPEGIMPMCVQWLGNSSVATVPTLYDLVCKKHLPGHALATGDVVLFASVGAGMNINAVCYRY